MNFIIVVVGHQIQIRRICQHIFLGQFSDTSAYGVRACKLPGLQLPPRFTRTDPSYYSPWIGMKRSNTKCPTFIYNDFNNSTWPTKVLLPRPYFRLSKKTYYTTHQSILLSYLFTKSFKSYLKMSKDCLH